MLSTLGVKKSFAGNSLNITWVYDFQIYDPAGADVEVWIQSPSGVWSQVTTSYSIDTSIATVIYPTVASMMAPLPTGWTLELRRIEALTQPVDITAEVSAVDIASAAQEAVDRLGMAIQQVKAEVDTGVPGPTGATGSMLSAGGITALPAKSTPADNDLMLLEDSADSQKMKKTLWSSIKSTLKTYFDTLYFALTNLDTDNTLAANSNSKVASQQAIKYYVDNKNVASLSDVILRGFELVYKTTADVYVNAGSLMNGTTYVNKVTNTTLTLATASDWYDGATHTFAGGAGWCYVGVDNAGNIKLLGANPPNKADASGSSVGTLLYSYISTTYWRVIGAVHVATNNTIDIKWFQGGNMIMLDVPISITTSLSSSWSNATSCSAAIPAISTRGLFGLFAYNSGGGNNSAGVVIRPNGSTWVTVPVYTSGDNANAIESGSNTTTIGAGGQRVCMTDSSQQIQYATVSINASSCNITVEGYYLNIR